MLTFLASRDRDIHILFIILKKIKVYFAYFWLKKLLVFIYLVIRDVNVHVVMRGYFKTLGVYQHKRWPKGEDSHVNISTMTRYSGLKSEKKVQFREA